MNAAKFSKAIERFANHLPASFGATEYPDYEPEDVRDIRQARGVNAVRVTDAIGDVSYYCRGSKIDRGDQPVGYYGAYTLGMRGFGTLAEAVDAATRAADAIGDVSYYCRGSKIDRGDQIRIEHGTLIASTTHASASRLTDAIATVAAELKKRGIA